MKNVEIPVNLNMALCQFSLAKYEQGITYCNEVIYLVQKHEIPDFGTLEKTYYRRGMCNVLLKKTKAAKADFLKANELA